MAEQVSAPKVTTLDVKPLGPSAAREIGTFSLKTKGPTPQEVTGKYVVVWEKVGEHWKLAADIRNDGKEERPLRVTSALHTNVRFWHNAENSAAPAFVRYWRVV